MCGFGEREYNREINMSVHIYEEFSNKNNDNNETESLS